MFNASTLHEAISMAHVAPGYWEDVPLPLGNLRNSSALNLTGSTTPTITISSHQARLTWAASDSAAVHGWAGFRIPRCASNVERDPSSGRTGVNLAFDMTVQKAGATDTITFAVVLYARRPGVTTQLGPFTVTTSAAPNSATYPTELSASFLGVRDASNYQLEPGDVIEEFSITPAAHTTDAVFITSLSMRYKRNVGYVPFTIRNRT